MTKSISTVKAPFQNLKFLISLNKVFGLVSCKLVNGRFKHGSTWNHCYCISWLLFHCVYSIGVYYVAFSSSATGETGYFVLNIVRYSAFFASLIPYHLVVVLRYKDFIKFSDKLETYDDKVTALGHRRKDNHIFTWLYFTYTFITLNMKTYYAFDSSIARGTMASIMIIFENIIPTVVGTYCVFITGIFLDMIRQRFRHLNETITPCISELLPVTRFQNKITVYDVRYLHGVLIDSAELIDTLYGVGTLVTFTSILLEFIAVIYLFIKDVEDNKALVSTMDLIFQVVYLFAMYHFTTIEANRVEERVAKYWSSFQNAKYRMDKIEMILYFYHRRFSFTAAEFFIVDLTILLSIASMVATFITLII